MNEPNDLRTFCENCNHDTIQNKDVRVWVARWSDESDFYVSGKDLHVDNGEMAVFLTEREAKNWIVEKIREEMRRQGESEEEIAKLPNDPMKAWNVISDKNSCYEETGWQWHSVPITSPPSGGVVW
jgi:hypothetical protein